MRTRSADPRLFVHVMVFAVPMVQTAPAAGPVTLMNTGATMKFVLLTSDTGPLVQLILIRAFAPAVAGPATTQLKVPDVALFWCDAARVSGNVSPPSRLNSI